MTSILFITAVEAEQRAIGTPDGSTVVVGGIGRTNAAAACTEAILKRGPFDAVISAGVAGVLPAGDLAIGDIVVASSCVYAEEGLMGPAGFSDMSGLGLRHGRRHGQQFQYGHHGDAFAGAGFTDNAKQFAGAKGKAHIIDRVHIAVLRVKHSLKTANFKHICLIVQGGLIIYRARARGKGLRALNSRTYHFESLLKTICSARRKIVKFC